VPVEQPKLGGWSLFRRIFRWFRIALLLLICAIVAFIVYLNHAGLPEFLKTRISAELARRGFDVAFSTLRLDGYRKIVVRNLKFTQSVAQAPRLFIDEATVRLDPKALVHLQLQIDGLSIREGRVSLPLVSRLRTNEFVVEHVHTELEFRNTNQWILNHGEGTAFGARLQLSGNITNALSLQRLKFGSSNNAAATWPEQLQQFVQIVERFEFRTPPEISLRIAGDARDLLSFNISFNLQSADARTPWGRTANLQIHADLGPSADGVEAHFESTVDSLRTPWGRLAKATVRSSGFYPAAKGAFKSDWQFDARELSGATFTTQALHGTIQSSDRDGTLVTRVTTKASLPQLAGIKAQQAEFDAELAHESPFRNLSAVLAEYGFLHYFSRIGSDWRGQWNFKLLEPRAEWGRSRELRVAGASASVSPVPATNSALGFWTFFQPFKSDLTFTTTDPMVRGVKLSELSAKATWNPPLFHLATLNATGLGGGLSATGKLDVLTRNLQFSARSDLDPHQVAAILGEAAKATIAGIHWKQSPVIRAAGSATLPVWTNWQRDWFEHIMPTLAATGDFQSGEADFRGIPVLGAASQFALSNRVWQLAKLEIKRSEGALKASGQTDLKTSGFLFQIESHLDPHFGTNFLAEDARDVGEIFQFQAPPALKGGLSGNWTNLDTFVFDGRIGLTNYLFKNEPVTSTTTHFHYTNSVVSFSNLVVLRGLQRVDIASGAYPVAEEVIDVTNVVSTLDPAWFAKISTRVIQKAIGPYAFDKPPLVHAYGRIPLFAPHKADIHFGVEGEQFHYWRFSAPKISGGIWWKGDTLSVTNIKADFYDGHLDWEGHFRFLPNDSADYSFRAGLSGITLPTIVADLTKTTNVMKGELDGNLVVTSANTDDILSWQGHGNASVRNGFLWNIPLFGNFTHLLGNISPTLGTLPATAADMTFTLEKSVVHTHDLEMKTSAMRLKYMGTVDIEGRLDAKVEAILLRDWVFGKAFSIAFWPISKMLEYRVTGTLQTPKSRPLYLPGILTSPLHSIKKLGPGPHDKPGPDESKPAETPRDQKENHDP
jgi:hypothetical protein